MTWAVLFVQHCDQGRFALFSSHDFCNISGFTQFLSSAFPLLRCFVALLISSLLNSGIFFPQSLLICPSSLFLSCTVLCRTWLMCLLHLLFARVYSSFVFHCFRRLGRFFDRYSTNPSISVCGCSFVVGCTSVSLSYVS